MMPLLHVVLDNSKDWLDYVPSLITAVASLTAVIVAFVIAHNQNRLQATLASRQDDLQERQLKKDLFDRRFAVFNEALAFISYVLRENGKIELTGPGPYRRFRESMDAAEMLFGPHVNDYLSKVDQTAREFWASAHALECAIAKGDVAAIDRNGDLLNCLSSTLLVQRISVFRPELALFHKGESLERAA